MRSRYQGSYIDRYIHLFTYNIINYCLQGMRTCNTYNLIKGGHGCQVLFCYSNPYQKIIPLSSIFVASGYLLLQLMDIAHLPQLRMAITSR